MRRSRGPSWHAVSRGSRTRALPGRPRRRPAPPGPGRDPRRRGGGHLARGGRRHGHAVAVGVGGPRIAPAGQEATFEFYDFQRSFPLLALAIAFAVLVVAVARWRGLFALVGIGVTLLALMQFILPALLAGRSALPVAIVGSTVIMTLVLYLAHGVSIRTTSALFGTYFGIVATALMGALATDWSSLTGIGSEDDRTLVATVPDLSMSGVVAATMVIAGLGVLNDVTVTQASAVWEMRALQPTANAAKLFTSAMRIGRDHIASSVYTLVFAYAGSAMTVLLLITAYSRPLGEMASTEELGQEIVRTLVGAIGLVLAVPVTTAIAVALAPAAEDEPEHAGGHRRAPA
ncbi:MAG: YibE/F family protein [Actinomycetales bacterium]|nr:MAG: YibE/F family protein [Actinomycetales bacterium]